MGMASCVIDTSAWPIVLHTADGPLPDAEVDAYLRQATEILLRNELHVTVLDATRLGFFSAQTRSRARAWIRQYRDQLQEYCAGTVYVVASPMMRFIVMTSLLVSRLPTPYLVCETREEALAWARQRLSECRVQ
jgi:hypothetical protein